MKKTILTLAAIVGVAGYTYGQGQVGMGTSASGTTQISTNSGAIGKIVGAGGSWNFALFISPSATTVGGVAGTISRNDVTPWTDPNWTFTGIIGTNTGAAGRFLAANDASGAFVIVPGTQVADPVTGLPKYNFIMVGWNTAVGGSTMSSLMTAYGTTSGLLYGASGICVGVPLGNNGNPANVALIGSGGASQTLGWQLSVVPPVPEPATFALAGLGAAAMLIFRRRK